VIPKAIRTSTAVKRAGTPVYQAFARLAVGLPGPRILANSPPKAGTHVLSTLLGEMPKVMFCGRHYNINDFRLDGPAEDGPTFDWAEVARRYGRVRPGQFATGHFPAHEEFQRVLRRLQMRTIVIFRDPRDMVVSAAFYIRSLQRHRLHELYRGFPTVSAAIDAAIAGVPPGPYGTGHASIVDRTENYLGWTDAEGVLTVRFEDLVGEAGGGSRAAQLKAVSDIANHIERPLEDSQLERICDRVFAPSSATFRKGQIGDWRNHLTPDQVEFFRARAGDQLIRLGYESGYDWE
jgi:hypothetical protein